MAENQDVSASQLAILLLFCNKAFVQDAEYTTAQVLERVQAVLMGLPVQMNSLAQQNFDKKALGAALEDRIARNSFTTLYPDVLTTRRSHNVRYFSFSHCSCAPSNSQVLDKFYIDLSLSSFKTNIHGQLQIKGEKSVVGRTVDARLPTVIEEKEDAPMEGVQSTSSSSLESMDEKALFNKLDEANQTVKNITLELQRRGQRISPSSSSSTTSVTAPVKGRPPVEEGARKKKVKSLQRQVQRLRQSQQQLRDEQILDNNSSSDDDNDDNSDNDDDVEQILDSEKNDAEVRNGIALVSLVDDACVAFEGPRHALTFRAGLLLQELNVGGGVSFEKMPFVIAAVASLLAGDVDFDSYEYISRSSPTLALAAEQASKVMQDKAAARFFDRTRDDRVNIATLEMDESNKAGSDVFMKLSTMRTARNTDTSQYQRRALKMDSIASKKAKQGSDGVIASIENELTLVGIPYISAGMTDSASTAKKTMDLVLERCDLAAVAEVISFPLLAIISQTPHFVDILYTHILKALALRDPEALKESSDKIPLQVYDRGGAYRFATYCKSHSHERIILPILKKVFGSSGLANDATVAQNCYSVTYVMKHERNKIRSMQLDYEADGDLKALVFHPVVQKFCGSRWTTSERASFQILKFLAVPATEQLIAVVAADFGGVTSIAWTTQVAWYTCPDEPQKVSAMVLLFLYLSHHSTDLYARESLRIVAFLSSPTIRLSLRIGAQLYRHSIEVTSFYHGKSTTHPKCVVLSCVRLESVSFEQQYLARLVRLGLTPEIPLSMCFDAIPHEAQRARLLNLDLDEDRLTEYFTDTVRKSASECLDVAKKYLVEPKISRELCLLLATEPTLAAAMAEGLLRALWFLHAPECRNAGMLLPPATTAATAAVAAASAASAAAAAAAPFAVGSAFWAFPGVTMKQLSSRLFSVWTEQKGRTQALALIRMLGLLNPTLLRELKYLAEGKLLPDMPHYTPGMPTGAYYGRLTALIPAICDSLEKNLLHTPESNMACEQKFTVCTSLLQPNACASTNASKMSHFANVREAIVQEERAHRDRLREENPEYSAPMRLIRSKESHQFYLSRISRTAEDEELASAFRSLTTKETRGEFGKLKREVEQNQAVIKDEMDANFTKTKKQKASTQHERIRETAQLFTTATFSGQLTLPKPLLSELEVALRSLLVGDLRARLKHHLPDGVWDTSVNKDTCRAALLTHYADIGVVTVDHMAGIHYPHLTAAVVADETGVIDAMEDTLP